MITLHEHSNAQLIFLLKPIELGIIIDRFELPKVDTYKLIIATNPNIVLAFLTALIIL